MMAVNKEKYLEIIQELKPKNVTLIAVSKLQSIKDMQMLYNMGQRDFGENYVQELLEKHKKLPQDIQWHFIGHLQRNKVKYIAPFIHLVQGVDSLALLQEINKQAHKTGRKISCLLQVHIAQEETKFGLDEKELAEIIDIKVATPAALNHTAIAGLMGMASFSNDNKKISCEMKILKNLFDKYYDVLNKENGDFKTLSMGMSGDYGLAMQQGSNMVRIGSLLFGTRPLKL